MDYIVEEFGVRAADKFYKKTEEWQDVLGSSPMAGIIEPLLNDRSRSYGSIVITKRNKLICYIEDETIFMDSIDVILIRRKYFRRLLSLLPFLPITPIVLISSHSVPIKIPHPMHLAPVTAIRRHL